MSQCALMDLYAENILDHFRDPRNTGSLEVASVEHEEENLACGDKIHLSLEVNDGVIKAIGWNGEGCAISQASMSILSEELLGKNTEDVLKLSKDDVYELLGVPIGPRRFKCALMSLHTVKNALHKHVGKQPQSWIETVSLDQQ